MRKIVKKVLAFTLAAAMVIQPFPTDFMNMSRTSVQAAPVTNTATIPAPQSRLDAAKSNTTWQVGAKMPYFRYDTSPANVENSYTHNLANLAAMDANTVSYQDNYTGTKKESTNWSPLNTATQASNQSYVELAQGQSISFKMVNGHGGDGVTVRYTLPDGSGTDSAGKPIGNVSNFSVSTSNSATVLGYENEDTSRRYNTYMPGNKVKVTSDYAWQWFGYDPGNDNPSGGHPSDAANGGVGAFAFDEVHFRLDKALNTGDTITITNSGSYTLGIDFIEVETTKKIEAPSGAVVVPAGSTLNNNSIKSYISKAEASSSKTLYFAPGVHYFSGKWIVSGYKIKIMGAGIWYTKLQFTNSDRNNDMPETGGGIMGDKGGYANGMEFCDMYINSNLHSRYDQQANYKCFSDLFQNNTKIHDIWEEHFECGFWIGKYTNASNVAQDGLQIYNCRIRNNFADGINFCQGTKNSAAYNNDSRNNGDDGLAMWNATDFQPDDEYNNIFAYNTVEFIWRAGGIAVYGGEGHKVYNNYVRDTFMASGIHLNDHFNGPQFNNTKSITFDNNVLVRTGSKAGTWGEPFGAIDILDGVKNVTFNHNEVYDSPSDGMQVKCSGSGVSFNNTVVFGVGISKTRAAYDTNPHSGVIIKQGNANVKFTNLIGKNVPNKNNVDTADKHWPYFCDDASNLPTIPANESKAGNTNYTFTMDANGNYTYSGGTYKMNQNASSFPGYDYNQGKTLFADGDTPVETTKPDATTKPGETTKPSETTTQAPDIQKIEISGLVDHYEYDAPYTYQKFAQFDETPDDTYKYLVLTYTGDITYLRFQPSDATVDDFGNVTDNTLGTTTWFNAEGQTYHFVTADGSDIPLVGDNTTIKIDLEASEVYVEDFTGFHVHTGDAKSGTGEFDITEAYLTNDETSAPIETTKPDVTTKPGETTVPEETTTVFGPGMDDIVLSLANSTSAYDNTGLEGLFAWEGEYQYQGMATYSGITSAHKYLVMTYTGDISSIRLQNPALGQFVWFAENEEGGFITVDGEPVPSIGDETTVIIDLEASGVDPEFFSNFHIHSGNGTADSVEITSAWLTANLPEVPTESKPDVGVTGYDLELAGLAWKNAAGSTDLVNGDAVTFTAAIRNNSNVDIPAGSAITLRVVVDGKTTLTNATFKNGLKGGEVVKLSPVTTWAAVKGGHTVVATVDPTNVFTEEKSEDNNSVTKSFNVKDAANTSYTPVTGGYDFKVTDVSWTNKTIAAGDHVVFTATIVNAGDQDAPAGTKLGVQFQINGNTADITWCDTHRSGLKAGEAVTLTVNGGSNGAYWTAANGTVQVTAWVNDTRDYAGELNSSEADNKKTVSLTVPYAEVSYIENPDTPDDLDNLEQPTEAPTEKPTEAPTQAPTEKPTEAPTEKPTEKPTEAPTEKPTEAPTEAPTEKPTEPAVEGEEILLNDCEITETSILTDPINSGIDAYQFIGYIWLKEATEEYRYMTLTYTGSLELLRWAADNDTGNPYWFADWQDNRFRTVDGSPIITTVTEPTTVVIDLNESGIWLGEDDTQAFYFHSEGMATNGPVMILDARLSTEIPSEKKIEEIKFSAGTAGADSYSADWSDIAGATYRVSLDGPVSVVEDTEVSEAVVNAAEGEHTLYVYAYDEETGGIVGYGKKTFTIGGSAPSEYTVTVDGTVMATVAAGKTYRLPRTANVGYYADGKLYKGGSTYTVNSNVSFSSVSLTMTNGAALKLTLPAGFRFRASLACTDMGLYGSSSLVKTGIMMGPNDSYEELGGDMLLTDGLPKIDAVNSGWNGTDGTYMSTLVNIAPQNYTREFIARAYATVRYADGSQATVYSNSTTPKTVRGVAQSVKNNKASYDRLTAAQKALLETFIAE